MDISARITVYFFTLTHKNICALKSTQESVFNIKFWKKLISIYIHKYKTRKPEVNNLSHNCNGFFSSCLYLFKSNQIFP